MPDWTVADRGSHPGAGAELHIASLVVHAQPLHLQPVAQWLATLAGAQVHGSSAEGKLVVTLETASMAEMTAKVGEIQRARGVLSATLVYQCADSLDAMNEEIADDHAQT